DPLALAAMWEEAEAAESEYARFLLPTPILGYSAEAHVEQFRFIANRRARQLGVSEPFPGAQNVLPWLDEQANLRKEKNFFETRVTEYQTGGTRRCDGRDCAGRTGRRRRPARPAARLLHGAENGT